MEAIFFWAGTLCLNVLAGIIAVYLYCLHGDLRRGIVTTFEITDAVTMFFPIEILLQSFICLLMLMKGDVYGLVANLPMLVYNIKVLIRKEYRCHALFMRDYVEKESIEKVAMFKTTFYGALSLYSATRFMGAFFDFLTEPTY